ncbi:hypothetical protein A3Q56_07777, partial [Intoshia linei]
MAHDLNDINYNTLYEIVRDIERTINFCKEFKFIKSTQSCIDWRNNELKDWGPGIEVQIDETQFSKRKYNRGELYPEQWVFGGVESQSKKCNTLNLIPLLRLMAGDPIQEFHYMVSTMACIRLLIQMKQKYMKPLNTVAEEVQNGSELKLDIIYVFINPRLPIINQKQLPTWMLQNCDKFVLYGYRSELNSFKRCFYSVFSLHNETFNIWTHLLGCILFFVLAAFYLTRPDKEIGLQQKLVFTPFFIGVIFCLAFSTLYHTLMCHSNNICQMFH